jgi:non-heme chloroperoxidase
VKIVKQAVLKIYEGADHGLTVTHQDRFNADLLDFINS